ncbi:uncharacterized protein J8A68_003152 [[Candida] subhashii]|uniref:F-box domain-containing protein n=1 Tax=[Candida] subhashii TaxID=561895 RepID=A0A8J5UWW2_9ASCO|nr:uncharacterized protein J8A68_003152 [[Candida] subhashii]KAG7663320.1 hypothetical protein J8A68_003152 [[Candida] subhashii]
MSSKSLLDLPLGIRLKIIHYLPQQAIINLALTNFEFYHPCMKQLYREIAIQPDPPLRNDNRSRESDFQDTSKTVIYGFQHKRGKIVKAEIQEKMIVARLKVLVQSLKVNQELIGYIEEIYVLGDQCSKHEDIAGVLNELIGVLEKLKRFYVGDYRLRKQLDMSCLKLESVVVDEEDLQYDEHVEELLIGHNETLTNLNKFAPHLKSLILPDDRIEYWSWMNHNLLRHKIHMPKLERIKIVFSIEEWELNLQLIELISWENITQLELIIGYKENETDYVIDFYNLIPECPKLIKLSIIQGDIFPTHSVNEVFDLNTFNFLTNVLSTSPKLSYLSIKHNTLQLGDFPDGVEGNYFRRWEIYMVILPKIINSHKLIVILPNLLQSFAGYEQYMNHILWNGCKCSYCEKCLGKLDKYLLYHKYFNSKLGKYRDLNASHLFTTIAYQLNQRMVSDELLTQLNHLAFPLKNKLWDFHWNTSGRRFRCYDIQTIDQEEYDDDTYVPQSEIECKFDNSLYSYVPSSMAHYVDGLVQKLINLNRGNAEADQDEELVDGGDVAFRLNIHKLIINGFSYTLDKEINGTHFYENVYDRLIT